VHDLYAYSHPEVFKLPNRILNRKVLANAIARSDATQIISACTKADMTRFFPDEMAHGDHRVIYQPVTVLEPDPGATPPRPYILCVAGHRKHKNMPLVIDAMRVLMDRGSLARDTALIIVGERSTETAAIEDTAARQGVALELLSSLSDKTLANLYGGCLAFVAPSEAEGFCLPLVEALMHGRRVVCSDIAIFHEVGRDACVFFSLTDDRTTNLANALQNALASPEPPREEHRFSPAQFAEACAASYANVLKATKPSP
jgi:glycosyltransferase involved in cell wall biosynthesis